MNARLANYMVCTMDERGFLEFPDPLTMDSVQQIYVTNQTPSSQTFRDR